MRAAVVRSFGGPEAIELIETPTPDVGDHEVLIKVKAASVNFADVIVRMGLNVQYGATVSREQFGLGTDVVGMVAAVGKDVANFQVGDTVIGTQERLDRPLGTQADFVVLEAGEIAPVNADIDAAHLVTVGLNGTTAYQALDALDLDTGQWVLITGAAGGVGLLAVELAALRGWNVIAQASGADESLVRGAGAQLFISRDEDLVPTVRRLIPGGVHGAVDAANLAAGAADAVRHGGGFVSLLNTAPMARREVTMTNLAWHTDAETLTKLVVHALAGEISLRVARTFALEDVSVAHETLAEGGLRGRIVLVP